MHNPVKIIWSVFICHRPVQKDLRPVFGIETHWVPDISFYMGDLSQQDLKNDWRWCEVKDKRTQAEFIGLCEDPVFPIAFPLVLTNGKIIDKEYNVIEKMSDKFKIGTEVVKNAKTWKPNDFDKWGRGVGIGVVVEPPFPLDEDSVDVRWPKGRCFEYKEEIITLEQYNKENEK